MMRKVWVIVANQAEVKIYRAENVNTLVEHAFLFHDTGKLANHDLVSDKQGSNRGSFGTDTMQQRTTAKDHEAHLFAQEIAHFLEKGVQEEKIERFYIIANPKFLGILRLALSQNVTNRVEGEIQKDILQATPEEVRRYLPPIL